MIHSSYDKEHFHLWAKSLDGAEYANAIYDNKVDGALDFLGIILNISKYGSMADMIKIEDVMQSLADDNRGMYAGVPGLVFVLSKCDGGCMHPVWN